MYPGLADAAFQDHVELVVQPVAALQLLPLYTHQRYWYGAAPPEAVAVQRMVLPAGCGAGFEEESATDAADCGTLTVKGAICVRSPVSLALPALRTPTFT
jgi:hypothetical protein